MKVSSPQASPPRGIVRSRTDLAMLALGAATLVLAALPVDRHTVPPLERSMFRAVNDHTVLPFFLVWLVMQLGNIVTVPLAAAVAAGFRRWRLAAGILLGGAATYLLAKQVKAVVPRGRPAELLPAVQVRGDPAAGRGFVSGHAAVVTLVAVLSWPYLGGRARIVVVVLAAAVCLARVYVSAHLPLDVVGGAALGLALAGLVRLILGRPG